MDIIQKIINARKENKLTQSELSNRTGIKQSEISRIERRRIKPSIDVLQRLADGMDMYVEINLKKK